MQLKEFKQLVQGLDTTCLDTMCAADEEYASGKDKFFNFKQIAEIMGENPRMKEVQAQDIAAIYLMKHIFSIVRGVSNREDMSGRYVDAINYLKLMYGMHKERQDKERLGEGLAPVNAVPDPTAQVDWERLALEVKNRVAKEKAAIERAEQERMLEVREAERYAEQLKDWNVTT